MLQKIAQAFDFLDCAELRTDQDLVETHLRDAPDAPACLFRRADEIHRGELCQFGQLRTLFEVDGQDGEHRIVAALLAINLHAVCEVFQAAEAAGRGPALRVLGGVGDPARAAPRHRPRPIKSPIQMPGKPRASAFLPKSVARSISPPSADITGLILIIVLTRMPFDLLVPPRRIALPSRWRGLGRGDGWFRCGERVPAVTRTPELGHYYPAKPPHHGGGIFDATRLQPGSG